MSVHMRTTIRLDDGLLEQARQEARRRGETLTALIEQGLRRELARAKVNVTRPKVVLPVSDYTGGLMPGVDITDNAALLEIMEEGIPLHKLR
jgi:hypothetical protein